MSSRPVGVSLSESSIKRLDQMAKREGVSRSGMIARLVDRAADGSGGNGIPDVHVGGVRFVPERRQ